MGTHTTSRAGRTEPPAGIATTSILRSPVVCSILHAKIRDGSRNDVVLVGDRFIQVKQVIEEGHLEHVIAKWDFDATICAAKVFTIQTGSNHEEQLIKREEHSSSTNASESPPQCLILALDSNDILFLYLRANGNGQHEFVHQTFPTPTFDRALFQPGRYLAVDHRSRALAVAAHDREIVVYAAKSTTRIQHELRSGDPNWCPVSSERPMQIDGVIQQMEFLIPPADDEDHVVLLVIVAQNHKIKAIRIDWHYASDIHHARIHEALPLDQLPSSPGLLIPLRNAGFLLANGSDLKRFDEILSGSTRCKDITIAQKDPSNPGESSRQPMWTNWCRPERGAGAADQLYLAREDGNVFHVYEHGSPGFMASSSNAGNMDCHIGTAFASVGGLDDPDILVTAGDMSSGCIKEIGSRFSPSGLPTMSRTDTMEMRLVESIPNWASVTDMMASTLSGKTQRTRDGVFVTSGRQPFGAVTELRYGLEARLSVILPLNDLGSVQNAWALPILGVGHILFVLSRPGETLFLAFEDGESDPELLEPASLDSQHETILAIFADGKLLQVTSKTICATTGVDASFEDRARIEKEPGDTILAATCNLQSGIMVTAERRTGGRSNNALISYTFSRSEEEKPANVGLDQLSSDDLSSEVLAIASISRTSGTVVVTSTASGGLEAFFVDGSGSFSTIGTKRLPDSDGSPSMCDNIAIIKPSDSQHAGDQRCSLIVCGLRDGRVFTMQVNFDNDTAIFTFDKTMDFGQSSVRLTQPTDDASQAYAMSGLETCRLTWTGVDGAAVDINSIWLTDKMQPALAQGAITSCTHTPPAHLLSSNSRTLADSVVFISGDELLLGGLDNRAHAVPRQIEVSGTPNRLLYLEQQRCIACASLKYEVRTFSSAPFVRRQIWPVLDFISLKDNAPTINHEMQPGERVYALLEWSFKQDDDKVYSFLLVGGSYVSSKSQATRGRITFLQPTNKKWEIIDVKEGRPMKFDDPVYALALLDPLTFVACYGFNAVVCRFNKDERKWQNICTPFEMHSAGTSISVGSTSDDAGAGALITISTSKDSSTLLRLDKNNEAEDECLYKLVVHCTAPRADASLHHLSVNDTALLTTKNGKIIGLQNPPQSTHNTSTRLLFEATLPHSLTRIKQAKSSPRWKFATPAGVLVSNIIGCSADGTLTGVVLLDERLWRRLSWLQRLCEWSEELSPHSFQTPVYSLSEESFAKNERGMPVGFGAAAVEKRGEVVMRTERKKEQDRHVDCDVLARVLEHGGVGCLHRLVGEAAKRQDAVGQWVKQHLDEELEAVEEMVQVVEAMVCGWL